MDNNSFEHINIDPERLNTSSESNIPTNDDIDSLDLKEQKRERYSQDTKYRKHLAIWVMWVVSIWLATVLLIITAVAIWDLPMESNGQCVRIGLYRTKRHLQTIIKKPTGQPAGFHL